MWSSIWKWAKVNRLIAAICAAALIVVFSGAIDGISARRAAGRYFDLAKGWADAYKRDTSASKKAHDEKIKVLTADRDAYRKKWELARDIMNRPWKPPENEREILARFRELGYTGRIK